MDPLVELYQESDSPYIYVQNNPILLTDPDGRYPKGPGDDLWKGIKQGFTGYFKDIKHTVKNPGETIKNQFKPEALRDNFLNTITFGGYGGFKTTLKVASAVEKGDLSEAGKVIGETGAEFAVAAVTEGTGKVLTALKNVNKLTKSQTKAINSFEKNIAEHAEKLEAYKADPMKFDNKGTLGNASKELQEKIIAGRVKKLEKEIQTFKDNIEKIKKD